MLLKGNRHAYRNKCCATLAPDADVIDDRHLYLNGWLLEIERLKCLSRCSRQALQKRPGGLALGNTSLWPSALFQLAPTKQSVPLPLIPREPKPDFYGACVLKWLVGLAITQSHEIFSIPSVGNQADSHHLPDVPNPSPLLTTYLTYRIRRPFSVRPLRNFLGRQQNSAEPPLWGFLLGSQIPPERPAHKPLLKATTRIPDSWVSPLDRHGGNLDSFSG